MFELRHYIDAFSTLHTAKVKGYKAPHKAVLLISIIDLIEEGQILGPQIKLTEELVNRFYEVWGRYLGNSAIFSPDIAKPFFHMQHESFWNLVTKEEAEQCMVAEPMTLVEEHKRKQDLPHGSYSVKALRKAFEYAEIDQLLFQLLQNQDARAMLRVVLINEYLTNHPTKAMPNLQVLLAALPLLAWVA